jgi:Uma2 family endonuclease
MTQAKTATLEDLARVSGKVELVDGRIVTFEPDGFRVGYAADAIRSSLHEYGKRTRSEYALGGTVAFVVDLPHRKTLSPHTAFYTGATIDIKFPEGAPVFAVEVRSEGDYGPKAEKDMAAKRADYFAAGTLIVWDVDMLSLEVVRAYHTGNPDKPLIYRRGDSANAEPAVPDWAMQVDELFPYHPTEQG